MSLFSNHLDFFVKFPNVSIVPVHSQMSSVITTTFYFYLLFLKSGFDSYFESKIEEGGYF